MRKGGRRREKDLVYSGSFPDATTHRAGPCVSWESAAAPEPLCGCQDSWCSDSRKASLEAEGGLIPRFVIQDAGLPRGSMAPHRHPYSWTLCLAPPWESLCQRNSVWPLFLVMTGVLGLPAVTFAILFVGSTFFGSFHSLCVIFSHPVLDKHTFYFCLWLH